MGAQGLARGSGILLAVSSLPSPYGIGTLGEEAFRFVDLLVDLKQKYWQVLPIGPTGFGDSPYQAMSAFAGNPYLIDLDELIRQGLLTDEEVRCYNWGTDESSVDYAVLFENRYHILKKAFRRFDEEDAQFQLFIEQNQDWLEDYMLFMALKEQHKNKAWQTWDEKNIKTQPIALANCRKTLYNNYRFWGFCQYIFYQQWSKLKEYANTRGIQLIGDVSFYVGLDSVDVWAHREQFQVDADGNPAYVAAAVPDKFSAKGQIWGSPLYNWQEMEQDGFAWWKRRMEFCAKLFDVIRIDHFSGFVKNYMVPQDAVSASGGRWIKGPGRKLVDVINEALADRVVIADDYGSKTLVPGVKKLLAKTGWMGTKVLMFAFDGDTANEHLPHNYTDCHQAVYAGTHDNETIVGYFREKTEYELAYLYEYLHIDSKEQIPDALVRCAYASTAEVVIVQMQDVLELGNEARMNAPATVGENWRWRLHREQLDENHRAWIRNLAAVYRR